VPHIGLNDLNSSFDASSILRACFLLVGLVLALIVGVFVGEGKWLPLVILGAGLVTAFAAKAIIHNLVAVCLVIATLDLSMAPAGFRLSAMEQMGVVAAVCWALVWWQRNLNPHPVSEFTKVEGYDLFQKTVLISVAYAIVHFAANAYSPYEYLAFGWRGATKTYAQVFGSFLMVVLLVKGRLLFPINAKRSKALLTLFAATLTATVLLGIVRAIMIGPSLNLDFAVQQPGEMERVFLLPGLNAEDSAFTLRILGPAAVLVGSTFLLSRPANLSPALPLYIAFLGLVGSAVSGGRAALVFSGAFVVAAMIRSRKVVLAFGAGALLAIVVAALLIIPVSTLKEAPHSVQRSVGWLRPDLQTAATDNIQGSTDWRWRLFLSAWEHYRTGGMRMILFGRSVGQMDSSDSLVMFITDEKANTEFAIRRVVTHNGLTDLLLGWGLTGYILIVVISLSCCVMLFAYATKFSARSHGSCWTFAAAMFLSFWLVYTHIGGSFVWPMAIVLILTALSQTDGLLVSAGRITEARESYAKPFALPERAAKQQSI